MKLLEKLFGKKYRDNNTPKSITVDTTPDNPCPFGYKTVWYAIKDETPQSVIEKLSLNVICESNWQSGLAYVRFTDNVFVSPVVDGFVLVIDLIGVSKDAENEMAKKHARFFNEFFYFGSHRIVDYSGWAKFVNGKLIRAYSYIGERGEVSWNEGNITNEELELGFDKFPVSTDSIDDDTVYPEEDDVIDIARLWSIDPWFNGMNLEKSTGYICKL